MNLKIWFGFIICFPVFSETLASYLNEEKRKNDEILQEKATLKSQVVTLNQQHTQVGPDDLIGFWRGGGGDLPL